MGIELSIVEIGRQDRLGEHLLKVELVSDEEYILIGAQYGIRINGKLVPFANEKKQDKLLDENNIRLATDNYVSIADIRVVEKVNTKGLIKRIIELLYSSKQ